MTSRHWILLTLASAVFAVVLADFLRQEEPERGESTPSPVRKTRQVVGVWYAEGGGLEFLLRDYYLDDDRNDFNDRRWNELLGLEETRCFRQLWIVNHAADPIPCPFADGVSELVFGDGMKADGLGGLAKAAETTPSPWFELFMRQQSGGTRKSLQPGELVGIALAFPKSPSLDDLAPVRLISGENLIPFRYARVSVNDLWNYQQSPSGKIRDLLGSGSAGTMNGARTPQQASRR